MQESIRLKLEGLDGEAKYLVTDIDTGKSEEISGGELMAPGLLLTSPNAHQPSP